MTQTTKQKAIELISNKKAANAILAYLKILMEHDHEGEDINFQFIEEMLSYDVDINYCDDDQENALFYVGKVFFFFFITD